MYYKNIEEALKAERPNDRIVKILSNKFAVVKCAFTDGTFDRNSYAGLRGGKIYFTVVVLSMSNHYQIHKKVFGASLQSNWATITEQKQPTIESLSKNTEG